MPPSYIVLWEWTLKWWEGCSLSQENDKNRSICFYPKSSGKLLGKWLSSCPRFIVNLTNYSLGLRDAVSSNSDHDLNIDERQNFCHPLSTIQENSSRMARFSSHRKSKTRHLCRIQKKGLPGDEVKYFMAPCGIDLAEREMSYQFYRYIKWGNISALQVIILCWC